MTQDKKLERQLAGMQCHKRIHSACERVELVPDLRRECLPRLAQELLLIGAVDSCA